MILSYAGIFSLNISSNNRETDAVYLIIKKIVENLEYVPILNKLTFRY